MSETKRQEENEHRLHEEQMAKRRQEKETEKRLSQREWLKNVIEALTDSTTLICLTSLLLTWRQLRWNDGMIPIDVALSWVVAAFFSGVRWGTARNDDDSISVASDDGDDVKSAVSSSLRSTDSDFELGLDLKKSPRGLGALFGSPLKPKNRGGRRRLMKKYIKQKLDPSQAGVWTSFRGSMGDTDTESSDADVTEGVSGDVSEKMTKSLMSRHRHFRLRRRRKPKAEAADATEEVQKTEQGGDVAPTENPRGSMIGQIRLQGQEDKNVEIDPLLKLRGLDFFLTDCAEEQIWKQPVLRQAGIRDRPMLVLNCMMPWANATLYFELPSWVKSFRDVREEEDDAPDVKALKRFLTGDEAYRASRLKLNGLLVDGPLAVRMVAPSQETELTLKALSDKMYWHQYDRTETEAPLLEVDCDCMTSYVYRKFLSFMRPHVKRLTVDIAIILSGDDDEEPSACLGMFRMQRVDPEKSAVLPRRVSINDGE